MGTLALAIPQVLGTGYGWVQLALGRTSLLHMSLVIVLLLPFARILATGLSIGSGGSGGIFGPGLVIGGFLGAGVWRLLEPFAPGIPHDPATFVIVGMMACFGSISRAPIAVILMVAEMTGSLEVVAPAMIAVGIATLIVRRSDATIYRSQPRTRNDSPAHRLQLGLPLLANVAVSEVMAPLRVVLRAESPATDGLDRTSRSHDPRRSGRRLPRRLPGNSDHWRCPRDVIERAGYDARTSRRCHRSQCAGQCCARRRLGGTRHNLADVGDGDRLG